ncbi:hypothetical protein HZH66_000288 [Vespula vulgaris]|uniref:Lymphocyte expansion molecule n=1 Tax=Vespula vulgaris TaxID=7454 RepID=A0A834NJ75_VESVU|nr:hypothetical protein HZH66_000288 [Vespula vulgaris]
MRCDHGTITFKLCRCSCKWRCKCLIPRKKKPPPPFNRATSRDTKIGLHPKLYTHYSHAPSVGRYNVLPIKTKGQAISWKRELETKQFSESLGGRYLKSRLIQKDLMITGRGPGTHEIEQWPENVLNKPCKSIHEDVGFGTVPRFKSVYSKTPGPGPRDETTLKGYMSKKIEDYRGWPLSLPGEIDKLLHKSNYYKGRITTCPRFPKISGLRMALKDINMCYKDPNDPGPGYYNPSSPRKPKNRMNYPFDSNIENVRPIMQDVGYPGPGRYKIKEVKRIKGNGWTWIFKSKEPRTIGAILPKPYSNF